jgi:hypothetical protein
MGQDCVRVGLVIVLPLLLVGCGIADSHSPVPQFMRVTEAEPPALEAPPDVRRMVGEKLDSVFASTSHPTHVRVSRPLHDPRGPGWTACVRAELISVVGKPLGTQTYRIFISEGVIADRRHVGADDNCTTEHYEPI